MEEWCGTCDVVNSCEWNWWSWSVFAEVVTRNRNRWYKEKGMWFAYTRHMRSVEWTKRERSVKYVDSWQQQLRYTGARIGFWYHSRESHVWTHWLHGEWNDGSGGQFHSVLSRRATTRLKASLEHSIRVVRSNALRLPERSCVIRVSWFWTRLWVPWTVRDSWRCWRCGERIIREWWHIVWAGLWISSSWFTMVW